MTHLSWESKPQCGEAGHYDHEGTWHTPEQIAAKLAEDKKLLDQGHSIKEMASHLEIAELTLQHWRNH